MSRLHNIQFISQRPHIEQDNIDRLENFSELLLKWNQKINLVSKKITNEELWQRHIVDSAQLVQYIPDNSKIVDFGSGAGFPGLVLAILGDYEITLIESDQRKCAFMQEIKAKLHLDKARIICSRIEDVKAFEVDIITSRALASVTNLLSYSQVFSNNNNYMLFLKGQNVLEEIKEAAANWKFDYKIFPDAVNKEGGVLKISNLVKL